MDAAATKHLLPHTHDVPWSCLFAAKVRLLSRQTDPEDNASAGGEDDDSLCSRLKA